MRHQDAGQHRPWSFLSCEREKKASVSGPQQSAISALCHLGQPVRSPPPASSCLWPASSTQPAPAGRTKAPHRPHELAAFPAMHLIRARTEKGTSRSAGLRKTHIAALLKAFSTALALRAVQNAAQSQPKDSESPAVYSAHPSDEASSGPWRRRQHLSEAWHSPAARQQVRHNRLSKDGRTHTEADAGDVSADSHGRWGFTSVSSYGTMRIDPANCTVCMLCSVERRAAPGRSP